jgi:hypothetical protein
MPNTNREMRTVNHSCETRCAGPWSQHHRASVVRKHSFSTTIEVCESTMNPSA